MQREKLFRIYAADAFADAQSKAVDRLRFAGGKDRDGTRFRAHRGRNYRRQRTSSGVLNGLSVGLKGGAAEGLRRFHGVLREEDHRTKAVRLFGGACGRRRIQVGLVGGLCRRMAAYEDARNREK